MKQILIFGTTIFAEDVHEIILQDSPEMSESLCGFVVDDAYYDTETLCNKPVYKYSQLEQHFTTDNLEILISVGYNNMNKVREAIFDRLTRDGRQIANYISPKATVRTNNIGVGNIILDNVNIGVKCEIGNGNIFGPGACLGHHSAVGNFNFFSCTFISGNTRIGDRCFFGTNSCTKDNIAIADETFIGAGCYLNTDTKAREVYSSPRTIKLTQDSSVIARFLTNSHSFTPNYAKNKWGGVAKSHKLYFCSIKVLCLRLFLLTKILECLFVFVTSQGGATT